MKKSEVPKELVTETYEALEKVKDSGKIRRGVNEVTKAMERGTAKLVIIAEDVEPPEIVAHLPAIAEEKKVPYIHVPSKKDLGQASGIDVGTTAIAITEEGAGKDAVNSIIKKLK